jgi:hypothetical protein
MSLADSSYAHLNIFWTMFESFLWLVWIWIIVFSDIFRSHDLSGWARALWFVFVPFIPLIGVLAYLIARGGSMHERAARQAQHHDAEAHGFIQQAAASSPASPEGQLAKLADLHGCRSSPVRDSSARRTRSWRPHSARIMRACSARWRAGPDHPLRRPGISLAQGAGAMALPAIGRSRLGPARTVYVPGCATHLP